MEFISAEEFLKQTKEIQEVFMEWWEPSMGDLFCDIDAFFMEHMECLLETDKIEIINDDKKHGYYIPLFTEGQLRKFIENKTGSTVDITRTFLTANNKYNFDFELWIVVENRIKYNGSFEYDMENDLLQAYWKVALEIAKESVENG